MGHKRDEVDELQDKLDEALKDEDYARFEQLRDAGASEEDADED